MKFVAVAIVSAIVLGQQKSRLLIGLNCILLCLNNSSQIAKAASFSQSHSHTVVFIDDVLTGFQTTTKNMATSFSDPLYGLSFNLIPTGGILRWRSSSGSRDEIENVGSLLSKANVGHGNTFACIIFIKLVDYQLQLPLFLFRLQQEIRKFDDWKMK